MSAAPYIHPEFRFISPKQRFRRRLCVALASLAVAGIGAALMVPSGARNSDAAVAPMDQLFSVETIPTVSPAGNGAVDQQPARGSAAQAVAQKRVCLGPSGPDGTCVSFQPPKVRMVRVGTPRAANVGQKGTPAKTAAASKTTELAKGIRETNKPQTSAHHQNQRRRSTASRGEARVPRWAARGAPGEYGGQGFVRNFW